jgi:hypothetical protein
MNVRLGTPVAMSTFSKEADMEFFCTARTILSVTARAWAIPLAHAEDQGAPRAGVEDSLAAGNCASAPSRT